MTGLILTRPKGSGGGVGNAFETLVLDSGTLTAVGADTLNIVGGTAIVTSGGGSPKTLTISVVPSEIDLGDLGDVSVGTASPGNVLSFNGTNWVPVDPSAAALGISEGPGISITSSGSPVTSIISLDICSLPAGTGSPTLDLGDTIAVCNGTETLAYTIQDIVDILPVSGAAWTTINGDSGTITADTPSDTLNIVGGTAVTTTAGGSPGTLTIDVDAQQIANQITLNDLGDVTISGSPAVANEGDILIYRAGSPGGWVNEPSTATDEFVKISATDTTTGHLDDKVLAGTYTTKTINNVAANETLTIDVDPSTISIQDLGNVSGVGSPEIIPQYSVLATNTENQLAPVTVTIGSPCETQVLTYDCVSGTIKWGPPTDLPGYQTTIEIFSEMREPTGHVDRCTESEISFNPTTRTFTIQPSGGVGSPAYYDYYIHGVKYRITSSQSVTIPDVTGEYFFYLDETETLKVTTTFDIDLIFFNSAFTAVVYWNADSGQAVYVGDERHGITMDGATHLYNHTASGTQYISGFALNGTLNVGVNDPTDADVQISFENGIILDEDLRHNIVDTGTGTLPCDLEQELNTIANVPVLYRIGDDWRIKELETGSPANYFPMIYSGDSTGYVDPVDGRMPFNEFVVGSPSGWQLTTLGHEDQVFVHYFATNDINHPVVGVLGTIGYGVTPGFGRGPSYDEARAEINSLSGLPFEEFTPLYSILWETRDGYTNTPKARAIQIKAEPADLDYIDWRDIDFFVSSIGGAGVTDHGNLSGLADDDHPQYTLNAYDSITDGTNTETASGRGNEIKFEGGAGIDVTVGQTGSPAVDTVTITNTATSPGNLQLVNINGQPTLVFEDTTRLTSGSPAVNKLLSVAEQALTFSINDLDDLDWLQIGNAVDADNGYIADFDGTVVFATAQTEDADGNSKGIDLYVNGSNVATLGTLSGVGAQQFVNTTLNIDVSQGDLIRLRGNATGGKILDTVAKITLKWRGN